jgi:hypothetical protein
MKTCTIVKPSRFAVQWDVRADGKTVASLRMLKRFTYSLAEARTPGGTYRFADRWGFFTRIVAVTDASGAEIGSARRSSWWKSDLTFSLRGETYVWAIKGWFGARSAWSADGNECVRLHLRWKGIDDVGSMELDRDDEGDMLLALLGIYCMKLHDQDSASGSAMVFSS